WLYTLNPSSNAFESSPGSPNGERHWLTLKLCGIEQGPHPEGCGVDGAQGHAALADVQAGEAVGMPHAEVAVRFKHRVLPIRRPQAQPAIVVMPVAFDMLNAKQRHRRQILKQ